MPKKIDAFTNFIREKLSPKWIDSDEPKKSYWLHSSLKLSLYYSNYKKMFTDNLSGSYKFNSKEEFERRRKIIVEELEAESVRLWQAMERLRFSMNRIEYAQKELLMSPDSVEYDLKSWARHHMDEPKFAEAINAMLATQDKGNLSEAVDTSHLKPYKRTKGP